MSFQRTHVIPALLCHSSESWNPGIKNKQCKPTGTYFLVPGFQLSLE